MSNKTKSYFTLCRGDDPLSYTLAHADGREIKVNTDWQFPSIASLAGWSPCLRCRRVCQDESDGTIDCVRRSAFEHILDAAAYLENNIGRRIRDLNGVFDYIEEDGYEH